MTFASKLIPTSTRTRRARRPRRPGKPFIELLDERELLATSSSLFAGLTTDAAWQFVQRVYQERLGYLPTRTEVLSLLSLSGHRAGAAAPGAAGHHPGRGHRPRHTAPGRYGHAHRYLAPSLDRPAGLRFDFGGPNMAPAAGYTAVPDVGYSVSRGYGWANVAGIGWADRGTPAAPLRDFNWGTSGTFLADVPNGTYEVVPVFGDSQAGHDAVNVTLQGQPGD
jgi:hypothetical protein